MERERVERLDGPRRPASEVETITGAEAVEPLRFEHNAVNDPQRSQRYLRRGEGVVVAHRLGGDAVWGLQPIADVGGQRGLRGRHDEERLSPHHEMPRRAARRALRRVDREPCVPVAIAPAIR